jgi:2-polyprenyl-6-hydroxyphenyl methylase/3-demethylubiquinone-9 3-methyltransferase
MFSKPVIDNDIYNRHSDGWWSQDSFLNILETAIQPVRSDYVRHCLSQIGLVKPNSLDIGCGGGIIAEDLAQLSATVTGVDISTASLETAREHAKQTGLDINYMESYAESLPFEDNSFELVTCCDVLEHVDDVNMAISEIQRVLKPGGIFVYDTVNRTLMSYLALIFVAQDFPLTRFAPKNSHVWHKFIRPQELQSIFTDNNLVNKEEWGMEPSVNPISMVWYILKTKYMGLDFGSFGNKTKFKKSKNKSISYLGYCVKQ